MVYQNIEIQDRFGLGHARSEADQERLVLCYLLVKIVTSKNQVSCDRIDAIQELAMYHNDTIKLLEDPSKHFVEIIDSLFPSTDEASVFFKSSLLRRMPLDWNTENIGAFTLLIKKNYVAFVTPPKQSSRSEEEIVRFFDQDIPRALEIARENNVIIDRMVASLKAEDEIRRVSLDRSRAVFKALRNAK